jgi:enoyl-CoA hydratase/carnithine racemase
VPNDEVLDRALARAGALARGPVVAHGLILEAIDRGLDGSLAEGLAVERELFSRVFATEDAATGIASFFAHGPGKATFAGR